MDVSEITGVPISFFIAENDMACTKNQAMDYIGRMTLAETNVQIIAGEDHGYFSDRAYDEGFIRDLLAQLAL